jgi:hypothetical protein
MLAPKLHWEVEPRGESAVLVLPSGPADRLETASLMYQQAIQSARERIWIASPYFVPDDAVLGALHLAALPAPLRQPDRRRGGARLPRSPARLRSLHPCLRGRVPPLEALPDRRPGRRRRHGEPRQPFAAPQLRGHGTRRRSSSIGSWLLASLPCSSRTLRAPGR